jgi:hypothetical protein
MGAEALAPGRRTRAGAIRYKIGRGVAFALFERKIHFKRGEKSREATRRGVIKGYVYNLPSCVEVQYFDPAK